MKEEDKITSLVKESVLKSLELIDKIDFVYDGIKVGTPFDLEQAVAVYGRDVIPNKLGIYHLFLEDRLVYIGMSKNLQGRLMYHLKDKSMIFNYCLWFCADVFGYTLEDVLRLERNMIKTHCPPLNTQYVSI